MYMGYDYRMKFPSIIFFFSEEACTPHEEHVGRGGGQGPCGKHKLPYEQSGVVGGGNEDPELIDYHREQYTKKQI